MMEVAAPRRVGVAIRSADEEILPILVAGLLRRGIEAVVRVEVEASPKHDLFSRALLKADRVLSRWLPGSRRPARSVAPAVPPWPHPAGDGLIIDGREIEAVIAVGPAARSPLLSLIEGPELYSLEVGARQTDFPDAPGAVEVLAGQGCAWLRLNVMRGSRGVFRGGAMAVQTHLRSIDRTGATLLASLPIFLDGVLRPGPASDMAAGEAPPAQGGPIWRMASRHMFRLAIGLAERFLFRFQWVLAVMAAPEPGRRPDWSALRAIPQPADRIWADPFLVHRDGATWLFFEDAPFRSTKGVDIGHLSVVEITKDGLAGDPVIVLDMPTHLSYPHVFEHDGDWYLMPETASLGRIELHRCTRWPDRWEWHSTLVDGYRGYDASIAKSGDLFWMFVARRAEGVSTTDLLDLFSAPSPLGPWALHPQSPVVQDVRSARPGGRILNLAGEMIRPAQDSSGGLYGRALRLQHVTRLDPEGFEEERGWSVEPNVSAGAIGIHSLAWNEKMIVVDICRRIPRIPALRRFTPALRQPLVIETLDRGQ